MDQGRVTRPRAEYRVKYRVISLVLYLGGTPTQWSEREETAQRAYVCNDNTTIFRAFM